MAGYPVGSDLRDHCLTLFHKISSQRGKGFGQIDTEASDGAGTGAQVTEQPAGLSLDGAVLQHPLDASLPRFHDESCRLGPTLSRGFANS